MIKQPFVDPWGSDLAARVRPLNDRPIDSATKRYVLCWVQQAIRAFDNPLIDASVRLGNSLNLPVLVYHGLRSGYPHASDRLHRFILGASRDLQRGCEARGLRCVSYVEQPDCVEKGLIYRLARDAAAVLTDDQPVFVARWQAASFAVKADCAVIAVDAARLVPTQALPLGIKTTPEFRKASSALRSEFEHHAADFESLLPLFNDDAGFTDSALGMRSDQELDAIVAACDIDHSLPPSTRFEASQRAVDHTLAQFLDSDLTRYPYRRNNPAEEDGVSRLSPYLHFGMVGPRRVTAGVREADVTASARWKYLDELLTWREWFHYAAAHTTCPESFDNLPASARNTLLTHASDTRPALYCLSDLLHGRTNDETWNAGQRQWLAEGYMHNNIRMYWAKKLLEWTPDPTSAWITACYINDRLSLDGRDPATYGNMQWCFGRAKPGYSEKAIYGWVAPKSDRGMRKRSGATLWLTQKASMEVPSITVPDQAMVSTGFNTTLYAEIVVDTFRPQG